MLHAHLIVELQNVHPSWPMGNKTPVNNYPYSSVYAKILQKNNCITFLKTR